MSDPKFHKLTPRAIKVWQISNFIGNLFFFAIPVGYIFMFGYSGHHFWFVNAIALFILLFWFFSFLMLPHLIWKNWRYAVDDKEIELKHGVVVKTHTMIPLSRVQHVDTRQGPILRWYKLSTVTISTAATTHEIPSLDSVLADRVRKQISTYARLAEEDV